jgi:hypothetical protein
MAVCSIQIGIRFVDHSALKFDDICRLRFLDVGADIRLFSTEKMNVSKSFNAFLSAAVLGQFCLL